ncbi:type II toxin-antitoxin system VapB family antitoxin [Paucibacter sp. PLA-PC-4]|uniref:type II toxin-antitoxin system VapB family antitoxin n=1 Tax=Paucibacter sp. PLA-PC-4 TaxID=2993655 RepID=UPI00224B050D|nr:type II toxin-antitoxin system VapB family antitoxin [Paucibacter sp. PLA-PC-4]MCX2864833.1 type II toxin-antitoxin system VapB family antitoxin [Paucibacter sp. PLA-PC-4]
MELAEPDMDKAGLLREAVKTFIRVHAGKRLAALGGAAPELDGIPRRRESAHR